MKKIIWFLLWISNFGLAFAQFNPISPYGSNPRSLNPTRANYVDGSFLVTSANSPVTIYTPTAVGSVSVSSIFADLVEVKVFNAGVSNSGPVTLTGGGVTLGGYFAATGGSGTYDIPYANWPALTAGIPWVFNVSNAGVTLIVDSLFYLNTR